MDRIRIALCLLCVLLTPGWVVADDLRVPNTFVAGTPVSASQMNENFETLADATNRLSARLTAAEARIETQGTMIDELQTAIAELRAQLEAAELVAAEQTATIHRLDRSVATFAEAIGRAETFAADLAARLALVETRGAEESAPAE